jgi:hypothetical protein
MTVHDDHAVAHGVEERADPTLGIPADPGVELADLFAQELIGVRLTLSLLIELDVATLDEGEQLGEGALDRTELRAAYLALEQAMSRHELACSESVVIVIVWL